MDGLFLESLHEDERRDAVRHTSQTARTIKKTMRTIEIGDVIMISY